jgi:hypothetical protein
MNANDIELALRARAAFNDSVERIDADTRSRLRELRLRAQHDERRHVPARWIWPTGAALTAALALAVFLPRMPHAPITTAQPTTTVAVIPRPAATLTVAQRSDPTEITNITAPDALETADPELLSDLDFYGWLAKQPNHSASGG